MPGGDRAGIQGDRIVLKNITVRIIKYKSLMSTERKNEERHSIPCCGIGAGVRKHDCLIIIVDKIVVLDTITA